MKIRALALTLLLAVCASVQAASVGPEVAIIQIKVGKEKQLQQVVIGLYDNDAPLSVANFKELCQKKFYNGMRFHRVFPSTLVQTGDPKSRRGETDHTGTGGPGYTIPAEIKLKSVRGSVAMARLPDNINPSKASNGSQFFVSLLPIAKLDGQYTVFGEVLEGLDVLDAISNQRQIVTIFHWQRL